jgi:CubicO group peptidase (beta-lactamase class C family)
MKLFLKILLGLVIVLGLVLLFNATKIKRLMTVNTLFDADKIVENFSNMDAAFIHHDLKIGEPQPWPEDIQDLPETVMIAEQQRALSDILEELDTTALVVIKDGKLIHESYYKDTNKDDLRISWSVAKSFMSGLYGQALENGQIESLGDSVDKYVPLLKGSAYEGVSLANILNMSSGVVFNEDYMDPKSDINDMGRVLGLGGSMDKYAATLKESYYEPGESWQYVSIDTHVAAMALRAVTGKSLHQLFEETYGANLGFGKAPFYLTDGKDVAFALGGLNLRTRDYAKFGQLFLQEGMWNGEQLVPADWVKDSTTNHAPIFHPDRGTGYGYQWWVPMPQTGIHKGDFFAVGIYGQYIYVNPNANIVIAKNAADREFTQAGKSGQTSIEDNIDMFRSLAAFYSPQVTTQNKSLIMPIYSESANLQESAFGEVFGLMRGVKTQHPRRVGSSC